MSAPDGPSSQPPATDAVHIDLTQDTHAPARARHATRETLTSWRLPELVDTVVLAVSELVTNAVRYGRPSISLELLRRAEQVRVSVHDGDPTEPRGVGAATTSVDAESGRGLAIVHALAGEVGVEQVADDGKIVRVDFDVPPRDSGSAQR